MAEHPSQSTLEPRNAAHADSLDKLNPQLLKIVESQSFASIFLLLWLINRRGRPLARGVILDSLFALLNL